MRFFRRYWYRPPALLFWALLLLIPVVNWDFLTGTRVETPETDEDRRQCLALNIYWEARSEPEVGQRAIAAVTLNRVLSSRFPNTICGVVHQGGSGKRHRCQFSWYCDGRPDIPQEKRAWQRSLKLADQILSVGLQDTLDGALFYHATHVSPGWTKKMQQVRQIGEHVFYRPAAQS
ncbi:MAG: cell wall hydrolase [Magnetospiraceae bacterium]